MADDPELLESLLVAATGHAGQVGAEPADHWPAFLERLARSIRAERLCLALMPEDVPDVSWLHGDAAALRDLGDTARMRMDRVYSQIDLPGGEGFDQSLRALRCPLPGGGHMRLAAARSGPDFRAIDTVRLSGLGRTIARALAGWHALRTERALAAVDRSAMAGLGLGWIILNTAGRVVSAPAGALRDLAPRAGLRLRADGWLDFAEADIGAGLQAAVAEAQATGRVVPVRAAVPEMRLRLSVQPTDHLGSAALILWLRWQRPLRAIPADSLAATFRISRSEARLAACIADGKSLTEAAVELGWTLETARSCSKQLYARMGVSGQTGVALALQGGIFPAALQG